MKKERSWELYAHEDGNGSFIHVSTHPFTTRMYNSELPIKRVLAEEVQKDQTHFGWIAKDSTTPSMIQNSLFLLNICFSYGIEAAEGRGQGERVQLKISLLGDYNEENGDQAVS